MVSERCRTCRFFDNDAAALEAVFPGLSSLSSAYAAVRAEDGTCAVHRRYVSALSGCTHHAPESPLRHHAA